MLKKKKEKEKDKEIRPLEKRERKWFIAVLDNQGVSKEVKGPYSTKKIKRIWKFLSSKDDLMVWGSGLPDWKFFSKIKESFFQDFK